MSDIPAGGGGADPGEEKRYRAACSLDPASPDDLAMLLEHLVDPSWRVRTAAAERFGAMPDAGPALPGLLDELVSGASAGARSAAAAAMARIGGPAVPPLVERLASPDPAARLAVVGVLGEIGERRATAAVAERLSDPDPNVRSAAAEALGKLGGRAAVEALQRAVAGPDPALRLASLDSLEKLRAPPPTRLLSELLQDRALRRAVYRLLGLCDDEAAQRLLGRGATDRSRSCREAALAGIAHQRERRSREALRPLADEVRAAAASVPEASGWIEEALGSEDASVAAGAVTALGWLGNPRRGPALAAAAENEDLRPLAVEALEELGPAVRAALAETLPRLSPGARAAALSALARLGDSSVFDALVAASGAGDEEVRAAAIEALGGLGDPRAVPPLAALLDHPEDDISGAAAAALCSLAARGAAERQRVLEHCRGLAGQVPAALLRVLGQIGESSDMPLVLSSMRQGRRSTRAAAAAALQALAERGLVVGVPPELLAALDDGAPQVRAAAAQGLAVLGRPGRAPLPEEAAGELAAALHDPEPAVQAAAAESIGRCQLAQFASLLRDLAVASGAEPEVAVAALRALRELGRADPAVLELAARHPDPEVVKEAVAAASGVAGERAADLLAEAIVHPRWDVRRAAARAIAARRDRSLLDTVRRLASVEEDALVVDALEEALRVLEASG